MKEKVQFHFDSFIDFKGIEHKFMICALSQPIKEFGDILYIPGIKKVVRLGVSICNPEDDFDIEVGKLKAYHRAKNNNDSCLFVTKPGMINTKLVSALLKQEAEYIKQNPDSVIKGYRDAEKKYLEKLKEQEFSVSENEILNNVQVNNNKHFLKKLFEIINKNILCLIIMLCCITCFISCRRKIEKQEEIITRDIIIKTLHDTINKLDVKIVEINRTNEENRNTIIN